MKFVDTPQQSAHWYRADATSAHDADLRRARKENLFPSVTSILQVKAKPGLDAWKRQEAILSALTLPRIAGESDQDFAARVSIDMDATGSKAAAIGTAIHAFAEGLTNGSEVPAPEGYGAVCELLRCWIKEGLGHGVTESAMVNTEYGYAGRIDWSGLLADGRYCILDFKTQNVKPGKNPVFYPEHCYQLAAYSEGRPSIVLLNVIIGVHPENPLIAVKEWGVDEMQDGWEVFKHCLAIWQIERGYRPHAV